MNNQRSFLDHLSVELGLSELKDWYRVDFPSVKETNKIFNTLLSHYGGLESLVNFLRS